jgi:hypothetical protein
MAGFKYYDVGYKHSVERIIPHELYNSTTDDYDIALLEVCIDCMSRYIHLYSALCVISLPW